MTTIIDHAIQVPTTATTVWAQISNLDYLPRWRADCKRLAYLSTQRRGKGTRLRCTSASGKEYVLEITAWYEGLGYEYRVVDGAAYESNNGRIRLQETPEGTIVQYTFTYALSGVLGGLRNSMGMKRTVDGQITDSLRNLYRFIRDAANEEMTEAKSLMRDAPSVEQRAKYKPRHPSRFADEEKPERTPTGALRPVSVVRPIIDEPLPAEDDTRPNRRVKTDENSAVVPPAASQPPMPAIEPLMPSLASLLTPQAKPQSPLPPTSATEIPVVKIDRPDYQPPIIKRETQETRAPEIGKPIPEFKPAASTPLPAALPPAIPPQESTGIPGDWVKPASVPTKPPSLPAKPAIPTPPTSETVKPASQPVRPTTLEPVKPQLDTEKLDTARISVFDVFGVKKPSETQQMQAVQLARELRDQLLPPTDIKSAATSVSAEEQAARQAFAAGMPQIGDLEPPDFGRLGLRLRQRYQHLALRRPKK